MDKGEQLSRGKAKTLYRTEDPGLLVMEYRDDTSAFDGEKTERLERKGRVNNQITCYDAGFLAQVFVFTLDLNLQSKSDVHNFGKSSYAKKMLTCLD